MHVSGIHVQHGVNNVSLRIVPSFQSFYIFFEFIFVLYIFVILITFDTKKVRDLYGFVYNGNAALWHCIYERHFRWRERENKKLRYVSFVLSPLRTSSHLFSPLPTSSDLLSFFLIMQEWEWQRLWWELYWARWRLGWLAEVAIQIGLCMLCLP